MIKGGYAIFFDNIQLKRFKKDCDKILSFSYKYFGEPDIFLNCYCITNSAMEQINEKFKKKKGVTTVLSFPASDIFFSRPEFSPNIHYLGEIFIAPLYIQKEKKEFIGRYLIHGLLHLFGYTHAVSYDRIEMEKREEMLKEYLIKNKVWN